MLWSNKFAEDRLKVMSLKSTVPHMVGTDLSVYNIIIKIVPIFVYCLLAEAIRNEFEM